MPGQRTRAKFIEPMLVRRVERLPEGSAWIYELKLDGYRAIAAKAGGKVHLWSRNENDFSQRFPTITAALANLPEDTIIDGEIVALDDGGKPSFNALQNYSSSRVTLVYYVFDVMVLAGRDVRQEKLTTRRELLAQKVLPRLSEPIRPLPDLPGTLTDIIEAVRREGLEGLVAKHSQSAYEAGERSGHWSKMRINEGQEFVIGGYTTGATAFDALIFGYYEASRLLYVARTRNGFTPALRQALMKRFRGLETTQCPFANLPETKSGRWGQGLTAEKMKECRWLKPKLVAQFEFVEWTPDNHLRHSRFIALREDKPARSVVRERAKGNG